MPSFLLPLDGTDTEPVVALQAIFDGVSDRAGFDLALDYGQPIQSLSAADAAWVEEVVRSS
jgi:Protein of unknown function (DUF4058)